MDIHHRLNVFFGSFPTLPDQRVIKTAERKGIPTSTKSLARGDEDVSRSRGRSTVLTRERAPGAKGRHVG